MSRASRELVVEPRNKYFSIKQDLRNFSECISIEVYLCVDWIVCVCFQTHLAYLLYPR